MVADGRNIFVLGSCAPGEGPNGTGCVFSDHRQWSADTPESPVSILALLFYRSWAGADPIDLRDAEVSFHLKGEQLKLDGAQCYFWVHAQSTRFHLTGQPLAVPEGHWNADPFRLTLKPEPSLWHRSWTKDPDKAPSLPEVLAGVVSYGFSFAGFAAEPTGRFHLAKFEIRGDS